MGVAFSLGAATLVGLAPAELTMQADGNLVLSTPKRAIWSSKTSGNPGAFFAYQSDANMVVYSRTGKVLWASGVVGRPFTGPTYELRLQNDGNLAQYTLKANGNIIKQVWSTRTKGVR